MTATGKFDAVFVDAYRDAAAAGADMRQAVDLLEHARATAYGPSTTQEVTPRFAEWIASTVQSEGLCAVLARVRDAVVGGKLNDELAGWRGLAPRDPAAAETAWLEAIGRAAGDFQFDLAERYVNGDIGVEPGERRELGKGIAFARKSRWRQCGDLFGRLGADGRLSVRTRARLLTILAEIEGFVRDDKATARSHLAEAEALNASDWRIAFVRGRLLESSSEPDDAKSAEDSYWAADSLSGSRRADALVMLGNRRKSANELAAAEELYVKACARASGVSGAYTALIQLIGHPSLFNSRRQSIEGLARRASLSGESVTDAYDAMVAAAEAMRANGDFDAFTDWNRRAVELDPSRMQAPLDRGYANLDRNALDAAAEDFNRVVEVAPEDPDGWWGMANVARERKDWTTQRDCALEALRRAPDWSTAIRTELESTANKVRGENRALATSLYDVLRTALGPSYEAAYQNRLANLHYYYAEYDKAVESYRAALRAQPSGARYLANLAIGLRDLAVQSGSGEYGEALDRSKAAAALEPENKEFAGLLADLEARQEFVRRFGTAAEKLKHDSTRLRVGANQWLLPKLVTGDDLQPWVKERTTALREAILKSHGFTLPSIRFTAFYDDGDGPSFILEIGGATVSAERVTGTAQDAMQLVVAAVRARLAAIFGHRQAREVAGRCGEPASTLVDEPVRLNAVTAAGRALLAADKPLGCADLVRAGQAAAEKAPDPPAALTAPIAIAVKHSAGSLGDDFATWVQAQVFTATGVLIPLFVPEREPGMAPDAALVSVGGAPLGGKVAATREAVAEALMRHTDRLLDGMAVTRHLGDLESAEADLVKVAQAVLPLPKLMEKMRTLLISGGTLRNLLGVLETLALQEAHLVAPSPGAPAAQEAARSS